MGPNDYSLGEALRNDAQNWLDKRSALDAQKQDAIARATGTVTYTGDGRVYGEPTGEVAPQFQQSGGSGWGSLLAAKFAGVNQNNKIKQQFARKRLDQDMQRAQMQNDAQLRGQDLQLQGTMYGSDNTLRAAMAGHAVSRANSQDMTNAHMYGTDKQFESSMRGHDVQERGQDLTAASNLARLQYDMAQKRGEEIQGLLERSHTRINEKTGEPEYDKDRARATEQMLYSLGKTKFTATPKDVEDAIRLSELNRQLTIDKNRWRPDILFQHKEGRGFQNVIPDSMQMDAPFEVNGQELRLNRVSPDAQMAAPQIRRDLAAKLKMMQAAKESGEDK